MPERVGSARGYAEEAEALIARYERISFAGLHAPVLHLIPAAPGRILDIGSGTGRDAAAFAAMGHDVVAVEPTDALRIPAASLHPSRRIEWLNDSLPKLDRLIRRVAQFDMVMLTAVWMHLDKRQRRRAMPKIARLLGIGGTAIFYIRHGPVPPGRRMFDVSADETVQLADAADLKVMLRLENQASVSGQAGIRWTRLAFSKP